MNRRNLLAKFSALFGGLLLSAGIGAKVAEASAPPMDEGSGLWRALAEQDLQYQRMGPTVTVSAQMADMIRKDRASYLESLRKRPPLDDTHFDDIANAPMVVDTRTPKEQPRISPVPGPCIPINERWEPGVDGIIRCWTDGVYREHGKALPGWTMYFAYNEDGTVRKCIPTRDDKRTITDDEVRELRAQMVKRRIPAPDPKNSVRFRVKDGRHYIDAFPTPKLGTPEAIQAAEIIRENAEATLDDLCERRGTTIVEIVMVDHSTLLEPAGKPTIGWKATTSDGQQYGNWIEL